MCALDLNAPEGEKPQEYLQYFEVFRLRSVLGSDFGRDPKVQPSARLVDKQYWENSKLLLLLLATILGLGIPFFFL